MNKAKLSLPGIHHVTAITADAQKNIDFYAGILGLRLVKLTVNFDDPTSYHLYYGDALGHPGTIMTFFAWSGAYRGRIGPPQVTTTAFAVPPEALDDWVKRLAAHQVLLETDSWRFGQRVLGFSDPDGLHLEIIGSVVSPANRRDFKATDPIPTTLAIRGIHGITMSEEGYEKTAQLLMDLMGFRLLGTENNRFRYGVPEEPATVPKEAGGGMAGTMVDLICTPGAPHGSMGAGVVHHVAFRTADDAQQKLWREELVGRGYNVSPIMDRTYFHSIYFREPGGVLFEIATDHPGFTVDQPAEQLGTRLMLPPWLEPHRTEIERLVTPLRLPQGVSS